MKRGKRDFGNMERPELTDEQKAEMADNLKVRLVEQLDDGKITQEQYDQVIAAIAEGKMPNLLGRSKKDFGNIGRQKLTDKQ